MSRKKLIEKITARVFCHRGDVAVSTTNTVGQGGNPLTIFVSRTNATTTNNNEEGCLVSNKILCQELARTCEWESAMIQQADNTSTQQNNQRGNNRVAFYLPNGDPVRFCAHAAMGAATELLGGDSDSSDSANGVANGGGMRVGFSTVDDDAVQATVHDYEGDHIVSLELDNTQVQVKPLEHPPTLFRVLRDAFQLQSSDLTSRNDIVFPTFVNATVMNRPKTLVCLKSLDTLHRIQPPLSSPDAFRTACDALDQSTGLYLYAMCPRTDDDNGILSFETRQFPRFSGYPEDPATGVAASALGVALHPHWNRPEYKFYQGTAMHRPSLIVVKNLKFLQPIEHFTTNASFQLLGRVEVDDRETIEV